jgi:hypothetical protein
MAFALAVFGTSANALAGKTRPLFEPTDLEMQEPGDTELDAQLGVLRDTAGASRLVIPDLELGVGLSRRVEIDLDLTLSIPGFSTSQTSVESAWLSSKVGLYSTGDPKVGGAWALGTQFGPKLPSGDGARGVGYEALVLFGQVWTSEHAVLNLGSFVDPGQSAISGRLMGMEAGLDLDIDLDAAHRFSVLGEVSTVRFFSGEPAQLYATGGLGWSATDSLALTATGLAGFLTGGDRLGAMLGAKYTMSGSSVAH